MRMFEHITFDGALQLECMSLEESEVEEDPTNETRTVMLCIRGCPWRSLRLQHFSMCWTERKGRSVHRNPDGMLVG